MKFDTTLGHGKPITTKKERLKKAPALFDRFVAENDGRPPKNQEFLELLGGGSMRDTNPLLRQLTRAHEAMDAAISRLPDIPDDISLGFERMKKEMWLQMGEISRADLADHRKATIARDERHCRELDDMLEAVGNIEDERDAERARAETAEGRLANTEAKLSAEREARVAAEAKRDELMEVVARFCSGEEATSADGKKKKDPTTPDLPFA